MHRNMFRRRRRRVRRDAMRNYLHLRAFRNLEETRRLAVWFGVDIQSFINFRRALGRKFCGACGQQPQVRHLLLAQKIIYVGPTLHACRRAHMHGSAPDFQHIETVPMLSGRGNLRFCPQIAPQIQRRWTSVGSAGRRFWRRGGTTTSKNKNGERQRWRANAPQLRSAEKRPGTAPKARAPQRVANCGANPRVRPIDTPIEATDPDAQPMPKSSTRSSGEPQRRQMRDPQSPQARGSATARPHRGQ